MRKDKFYLSTIDSHAQETARQYALGLEIAEYCTAWNMDDEFTETDSSVWGKLDGIHNCLLHAPFNELFPCAVDRKARELATYRYRQAIELAKHYGATKVIIHGGYNPWIYYPVWYVEQSCLFWQDFLKDDPGIQIVLENVLETKPEMLLDIVKAVDDPRLQLCLDVGHVNTYSKVPVLDWLKTWAPYLSHFHLHNNDALRDTHSALACGSIPMRDFLNQAQMLCPNATFTLEVMESESSVRWLLEE